MLSVPLLPDPATAGFYAAVIFLVVLGALVLFVETVTVSRFVAIVVGCFVVALVFVVVGEIGLSFIPLAVGGAFVGNQVFEWLTTR